MAKRLTDDPASARKALDARIDNLNREFVGRGRVPLQIKVGIAAMPLFIFPGQFPCEAT